MSKKTHYEKAGDYMLIGIYAVEIASVAAICLAVFLLVAGIYHLGWCE